MVISRASFVFLFVILGMMGYLTGGSPTESEVFKYTGVGLLSVGTLSFVLVLQRLQRWQVVVLSFLAAPIYWGIGRLVATILT
jgi:hypothetical protein